MLIEVLTVQEDKYENLKALRRAKEMLSITPEEGEQIDMKRADDAGGLIFHAGKASVLVKEIPVDEWVSQRIRNTLSKAENDGKLKDGYVTIYEKFVIDYQ